MSIKCGAHDCVHNDNSGNCYAGVVSVRGTHSSTTDETMCKSFAHEELKADAEFAVEFNSASSEDFNIEVSPLGISYCQNALRKSY